MSIATKKSTISKLGLLIWLLAAFFFLYEFFLRTFVGSLAHQIIPDLHLNVETFAIMGSSYYLAYGVMQIPVGMLADKFGVRNVLTLAVLVCAFSTYLFAHSTGFATAFISRVMMGFGSSFAFICLLVIAMTWFPRKYFGVFSGASQFFGTMGPLLAGGPLVAMVEASGGNWRGPMQTAGLVGLILAALIFLVVRNKSRGGKQVLIYLKHDVSFKANVIQLLKNRQAWAIALYSGVTYAPVALLGAIWGTQYLEARGLSQHVSAYMVSLAWLGYAIGCPFMGVISDLSKRRRPGIILCAITGLLSTALITYLPTQESWIYGTLFFALGIAAAGQNIGFAAISEQANENMRATALGLNNGSIAIFDTFIAPLASYFIYLSAGGGTEHLKPNDFTVGFTLMPILYGLGILIACFFIQETYCKPQKEAIVLQRKY